MVGTWCCKLDICRDLMESAVASTDKLRISSNPYIIILRQYDEVEDVRMIITGLRLILYIPWPRRIYRDSHWFPGHYCYHYGRYLVHNGRVQARVISRARSSDVVWSFIRLLKDSSSAKRNKHPLSMWKPCGEMLSQHQQTSGRESVIERRRKI